MTESSCLEGDRAGQQPREKGNVAAAAGGKKPGVLENRADPQES